MYRGERELTLSFCSSSDTGLNEFVAMHKYLQSVRESFQFFDRDRSGNLDLGELYQAISRAGFNLTQQVCFESRRGGSMANLAVPLANKQRVIHYWLVFFVANGIGGGLVVLCHAPQVRQDALWPLGL
jgi:hypothetical protein